MVKLDSFVTQNIAEDSQQRKVVKILEKNTLCEKLEYLGRIRKTKVDKNSQQDFK